MAEPITVEVWIAMDSDGDWEVSKDDSEDAVTYYAENIGGSLPLRVVKLNVTMRPPEITEASVTVSDEAGQTVEVKA